MEMYQAIVKMEQDGSDEKLEVFFSPLFGIEDRLILIG